MRPLLALLGLLAVFLLAAPAVALRAGAGDADAILQKLGAMNTEIDGLLAREGPLRGNEVDRKIEELKRLHRQALSGFPDVWGIPFVTVYDKLQEIDEMLSNRPPLVGMAWRAAKELEEELRDNGKGVPKDAAQGVYELKVALNELLGQVKELSEDELVRRARELKGKKRTLLIYEFPRIFGHTFWRFFEPLEGIQSALEQAGLVSTTPGDRRKLLMRARKLKESIISMLAVPPCKPAQEGKRTIAAAEACPPVLSIAVTFERPVTTYRVTVRDRDSKRFSYRWQKQGSPCGVFKQSGPTATWSHPDAPEGNCPGEPIHAAVVSVIVSDGIFSCRAVWPFGSASTEQVIELGKTIPKPAPCARRR